MMMRDYPFKFNPEKAKEVLLYIVSHTPIPDRFHVCKVLYFADRYHLEHFGRFVCGERYVAMKNGPVPSRTYDLIKAADREEVPEISVDDWQITALRDANLNILSGSDIEALDWAIEKFGNLSFGDLWRFSHDDAVWKTTTADGELLKLPDQPKRIPMEFSGIVNDLSDSDALIEYLQAYF